MNLSNKACAKCNLVQEIEQFRLLKSGYRYPYCSTCNKVLKHEEYLRHSDSYKTRAKKNKEAKPEHYAKLAKENYEKFKLTPEYKEYRKRNRAARRSTVHGKLHDNFSSLLRNSVNNKGGRSWEN